MRRFRVAPWSVTSPRSSAPGIQELERMVESLREDSELGNALLGLVWGPGRGPIPRADDRPGGSAWSRS